MVAIMNRLELADNSSWSTAMTPLDTPVAPTASPQVSISAYQQVAELERNAADAARRIKELEAMVADLRQKEVEHMSTISELESTLVKAANLQQHALKDREAKERDFGETIAHLEQKVAQAMAEMHQKEQAFNDHIAWLERKVCASPGKSDLKSELAASKQREKECQGKIESLEKELADLQDAPAILKSLLEEAAKKDQDHQRELDRLRQELQPQQGAQERPPRQRQASPVAQRQQDLFPGRAPSPVAGMVSPAVPSSQGNASLKRACESVAKLESEMQKFREQFQSRDQLLRDLQARFVSPSRSPERHRSLSKSRTSMSRPGGRSASPDAFGDPVVAEWRMHLERFNPSASGELLQVQFQRLTELEAEVTARVQQRPELAAAVQAVRQEKMSQLSRAYQAALAEPAVPRGGAQAVAAQRRQGVAPSSHAGTPQREAAYSSSTPNGAASMPQGCASAVDTLVTVAHSVAASVPAGIGASLLPGCAASMGGSANRGGSLCLPPRGGMLLSVAPPRVQAGTGEPQSLRGSLDSQSLRGSPSAAALRRDVQELRSQCRQVLQGSSLRAPPGAQQSTTYPYRGVMTARPTLAASAAMLAVQEMVNPVLLSHPRPAARSVSPPAVRHNAQHWH